MVSYVVAFVESTELDAIIRLRTMSTVVINMATLTSNETVQIPSPQIKRPNPPRPPSPIYEYVPSIEMKSKMLREGLGSDTQLGFEAMKANEAYCSIRI